MSGAPTLIAPPPAPSVKMGVPMAADRPSSREERRLAKGLRKRDPEALRAAYERFGRLTFGFLVKALGDRAAAEDVQQQVFLEVWQRGDRYDPGRGALATWLMTIARSRAIDHMRRREPEPREPEGVARALDAGGAEGEDKIDRLVEQWRMRELLDRLPGHEAALLRQRFYLGLTQTEISERDGIPLGTVKTRMVSGLARLRELIDEEEGR